MEATKKTTYQMMIWKTRRSTFLLNDSPVMMGILNTTPDSFSDGGEYVDIDTAVSRAMSMVREGAEIIDVGGESTRPGSEAVSCEEELSRVVPVISALRKKSDVCISIDTSKAEVADAALAAGADIVNDVTGLKDASMVDVCARWGAGVVVMHMQGEPRTMQERPDYSEDGGVVASVSRFFNERFNTLVNEGVKGGTLSPESLCFDPGIGFGKTLKQNLELLQNLSEIQNGLPGKRPLLLGLSRKSMIGILDKEELPENRDISTATLTALAVKEGVLLHRVHHVAMNHQAAQWGMRLQKGVEVRL